MILKILRSIAKSLADWKKTKKIRDGKLSFLFISNENNSDSTNKKKNQLKNSLSTVDLKHNKLAMRHQEIKEKEKEDNTKKEKEKKSGGKTNTPKKTSMKTRSKTKKEKQESVIKDPKHIPNNW